MECIIVAITYATDLVPALPSDVSKTHLKS